MDSTTIAIVVGLYLLGKGGKAGASTRTNARPASASALLARANQRRALDWIPFFRSQDASPAHAAGLARWAGIESSGDPLALSPIGERGLLQCTVTTSKGIFSAAEWASMRSAATRKEEHARLAVKLFNTMWARAKKHVKNPPSDVSDMLFYAKMWHQRPKDVIDAKMHGPALPMARDLAIRWKGDAAKMARLQGANVIAFGKATP